MRTLNLATWPRRRIFELFQQFEQPHFSLTANLEVTRARELARARGLSFFQLVLYFISRAANEEPNLRLRIRGDEVIEHEWVHPSYTVPSGDLFNFATSAYSPKATAFFEGAQREIDRASASAELFPDEPGRDDLIFLSCIPWVSFTSITHAMRSGPSQDSFPRFAWGKFFREGTRELMPVSAQAHHALVDGLHLGRFYENLEALLADPEKALANSSESR